MNKLSIFLDTTENNKFYKIIYYLFLPITSLIEFICYKFFWHKIISILLTDDDMVDFFDENEFTYKTGKLYKIDIVEQDSFFDSLKLEELKLKIYQEFSMILIKKIGEITAFNLEEYINVSVQIDIVEGLKQYTIILRYYRYYAFLESLKYLFFWCIIVASLILSYIIFL